MTLNKLLYASVLLVYSCDPVDDKLIIVNESSKDIYYQIGDESPDTTLHYPPFAIDKNGNRVMSVNEFDGHGHGIKSKSRQNLRTIGEWEHHLSENDTLIVFVFDASTVDSVNWQTIKSEYLILRRFDLSRKNLDDMNWTVVYR